MAAFIVFVVVLWGGTMGFTLLLARFRLTSGDATVWDQVAVRGVALFTVTVAMWSLASLAGRITAVANPAGLVPYLWLAAAVPLLAPAVKSNGAVLVSAEHWVYLSLALTGAGGVFLALMTIYRVFSGGVTLQ